jgi:hypothetical protein
MNLRKRIIQLVAVITMGVVAHLTAAPASASAGPGLYCADSCGALVHCEAGGGGFCTRLSCYAVDKQWHTFHVFCWAVF